MQTINPNSELDINSPIEHTDVNIKSNKEQKKLPSLMIVDEDVVCSSYLPRSYAQTQQNVSSARPRRMQSLNLPKSHKRDSYSLSTLNRTNYGATIQNEENYSMIVTNSLNERSWRESSRIHNLIEKPSMSLLQSMIESIGPIPLDYRQDSLSSSDVVGDEVEEENKRDYDENLNDEIDEISPKSESMSKKRLSSVWLSGWNVFNFIQGIGIMGIPFAFMAAGWLALPITLLVGFMCCFSGKLIAECMYDRLPSKLYKSDESTYNMMTVRRRLHTTYACVAGAAFPTFGRQITAAVVLTELIGASVLYVILLGTSVNAVANQLQLDRASISLCMTVFGYMSFPLLLLQSMRIVAWFSLISVSGLMVSVASVLAGSVMESQNGEVHWEVLIQPNPQMIPVSLSIILFSYCAHAVLPGIECSMQKPRLYARMLNITFLGATIVKIIFGGTCALTFGDKVEQAATNNIVNFPLVAMVAHVSVAVNVFFSLPLVFYIVGEQLDYFVDKYANIRMLRPQKCPLLYAFWVFVSRGSILSFVILIGLLVPHFALIMGMVGAMTGSLLCFVMPSLFHMKLFWKELTLFPIILRISTSVFGIFAGSVGFVCSALELRKAFKDGH